MDEKPTVVVAMSGGVDSSVAAATLAQQGYKVVGITMKVWSGDDHAEDLEFDGCCSLQSAEDARQTCAQLSIPHYVVDCRKPFAKQVIEPFCREYLLGRTPNPCITCNFTIKFGFLLEKALAIGATYIASGHYARIRYDPGRGRYLLSKSNDPHKDQTYTLYPLTQYQLSHLLLPLGDFTKAEIRDLAVSLGLRVARKPDSQEICFIPRNDYRQFLQEYAAWEPTPGPILNADGDVIGTHHGIAGYTVGQRRGIGVSAEVPFYVLALDAARNAVVIGPDSELWSNALVADNIKWIARSNLTEPIEAYAKVRYRQRESPARVYPLSSGEVRVEFERPQRAITPGQAVVFYQGDEVIGGGIIKRTL